VTTSITRTATSYLVAEDRSWLHDGDGIDHDVSSLTLATHFPDGLLKSGTGLVQDATSGLWEPNSASGGVSEVQTLTVGGSGLTSFTLTYAGQTTASIDDAATAADVKTALAALSNLDADDIDVTGDAGGPWTITFVNAQAGENVPQLTTTPTGGTGTVTPATATAGSPAQGDRVGLLYDTVALTAVSNPDIGIPIFTQGKVRYSKLPTNHGVNDAFKAACAGLIEFI
jgi:hypothetical protein